jgi:hypothetical protein
MSFAFYYLYFCFENIDHVTTHVCVKIREESSIMDSDSISEAAQQSEPPSPVERDHQAESSATSSPTLHDVRRSSSIGNLSRFSGPIGKGQSESLLPEKASLASSHTSKKPISWWWWWEIASATLSATSLFLIITLLGLVDDKPLDSWHHPIQPSALLSVLTTIGRTAMMVSVASCVSQLKWSHFQRPSSLNHLQIYDDASRGPWGAFMAILRPSIWLRDVLAGLFAVITIFSLVVEPMAQQILAFETQEFELTNVTAVVASPSDYLSYSNLMSYSSLLTNSTNPSGLNGDNTGIHQCITKIVL